MAKKNGQRHRTEQGTRPSQSTMQVEDGKDNRNVRPPTADPANVNKDIDLDQQFAKLREDADKRLQEAQENARREAERQEHEKKVEAEANEMYRQKNADIVHVDDNDRYMAAKYQEQRQRELAREAESHREVTVEEAIAAYEDYVPEDDTITAGTDYQPQTSQTDPSYPGSAVQTGGQAQYTSTDYVQQPIPEMPSMESLNFNRTVPYGSGLSEAQKEYNEMMQKPVGEAQQTSSVPYTDGNAAEPAGGSYLSDGPFPSETSGTAYTGSVPTPESAPSYGGSQAGTSAPFYQDQVHAGSSPTGTGSGSVSYQSTDRSGLGAAQQEYERQMHERPVGDNYESQPVPSQETSDPVQTSQAFGTGSSPETVYNREMKSPEYKAPETAYYPEDHPAAGYENHPSATQEQNLSKPSVDQTVPYNASRTEEPRSYQNQNYDRSGIGMAQQEYDRQMHERSVGSQAQAQTDFTPAVHDAPTPKAPSEGVMTDGTGKYYNSQTKEPVYKSPEGSFYNADEAVARGIVTEKQVETDRQVSFTPSQGQMYQDFASDAGRTSKPQIQSDSGAAGQQVSYDRSSVGIAQQEYNHQMHTRPGELGFQAQPQKGSEFPTGNNTIPYTKTSTEGIVTDGQGRYFNSETKEPAYRTPEGTYHSASEAVSLGIVTNEQVNADRQSAANLQQSVPYGAQENPFSGSTRQSEYQYGRSGVGAAQQDFEKQMNMRPGSPEKKSQTFADQPEKGTEFVGTRNEVPYYKTSTEGVTTDGRGRYYNPETREPVYKAPEGGYRSAEEAVSLGMVTKEQVNADRQSFVNPQQRNIPYGYPESQSAGSTKQSEYQFGRSGVGAAQQDFEQQMHVKPGSPETKAQAFADQTVKGTEFVGAKNEIPYAKTSTEGVITYGRGRHYTGETREPLYQTADGKFHNAEEAVSLGLVTKEQIQVDKQRSMNLQQQNVPYEAGTRFTGDSRQSEYQYGRSGVGAAQQDFEQQMHVKPGSPEAKAQAFADQPVKGTEFVGTRNEIPYARTSTEGVITDRKGRYFSGETREPLYQTADGKFHNAEEAVSLGLVTKEQVQVDKQRSMNLQQQNVPYETGTRFTGDTRQSEYQYGRSGVGAAQQEFEEKMHIKPGSPEAKAQAGPMPGNRVPLTKTSVEGVLTDGQGRYFNSETRELVYKDQNGAFHNAEEAIALGVVTKERADADRMNSMRLSQVAAGVPPQTSSVANGRGGFDAVQQQFEQRVHINPNAPGSIPVTPLLRTSTDGILTDGKGKFFDSKMEPVYRDKDGNFHKPEEAVSLGLVSKDQVEADRASRLMPETGAAGQAVYGGAVPRDERSGLSMAQQEYDAQIHAKPNDPMRPNYPIFAKGEEDPLKSAGIEGVLTDGKGGYFDSQQRTRLYKSEEGKFVSAKDAVALGIVTEAQAKWDLINDRLNNVTGQAAVNSPRFMTSDSVRDKAKLVDLRKELGFGANVSGFTPDDPFKSFMQNAQKEGQAFATPDAAFAQSRLFQMKLAEGLAPEAAYAQSKETFLKLMKEGHTSESIVASLNPNIKQADIEFLKHYGDGAAGSRDSFAVGQLQGRKAVVGVAANPQAKKIAMRVVDKNGRPKKTRTELMTVDPKGNIPLGQGGAAAAGSKKVTADYDKDGSGVVRHNLYHPAGRTAAIARGTQSLMLGVGSMGMTIFYQGSGQSASGLRRAQDALTIANLTVGMSVINTARRTLNRPLAFELSGLLKANGATSLDAYKKSLNARFAKVGVKAFSTKLQGSALVLAATKQMAAIKVEMARKGSTAALREAYAVAKEFRRIGMLTTFAKAPHKMKMGRRTFRLGGLGMRMLLSSTGGALQGIETVTRYTQNAMMAGRAFLWASRNGAKLGVWTTGGAINLTGKAATKVGNAIGKAAAKTGSAGGAKVAGALQKYGRGVKKVGTAKRGLGKKINHVKEKVKSFTKDPFGIKRWTKMQIQNLMMKAWGKLTARFAWLNKFGKGVKVISKIASVISAVASAISQVVFFAIGIFLLCIIVLLLLNMIIPIIASAFNFGAYEETVQDIVVKQIEDCYEEDIQRMIDIAGDYDTSTVDYDDTFRDIDKYNEMKSEADASSFVQSTNCAEIISMTLVRFEYDMDIDGDDEVSYAQKREIQKYIKELYYGSHEIYVDVSTTSYQVDTGRTDDEGNPVYETRTRKNAALTYRTYYFNYLFDEDTITLGRSETPVIYTGEGAGGGSGVYGTVTSWDDMYVNMRQNGFTHEGACGMMANLAFETAGGQGTWTEADIRRNFINTTLISNDGYDSYGIVQWTGGRKTNLINWCLENNYDYTTIAGQLAFMYYEMSTGYTGTYNYLRTSGHSAHDCGRYVADHYEICAEQYREGRAVLAETFASMYAAYKDDYSDLVKAGDSIVQYAVQYVGRIHYTQGTGSYIGTRYLGPDLDQAVYRGGTPTIGTDCSGFVYSVFKHFGITTPTYTGAYTSAHRISLSEIQPGDILYRDGHVGIYIGNGQLVQSSSCYGGDHSEDLNIRSYNASSWTCAYRYWE